MKFKTKREFLLDFLQNILPLIEQQEKCGVDKSLRRQTWNDTVDALLKSDELPPKAIHWSNPFK